MNRVSIRTMYVGAEPACYGKTAWAHRPANETRWTFEADDGTRIPCNAQDVTVWVDGSGAVNAA